MEYKIIITRHLFRIWYRHFVFMKFFHINIFTYVTQPFNLIQFKTFLYDMHSDYHIVHMSIQGYLNENLSYISQTKSIYVN